MPSSIYSAISPSTSAFGRRRALGLDAGEALVGGGEMDQIGLHGKKGKEKKKVLESEQCLAEGILEGDDQPFLVGDVVMFIGEGRGKGMCHGLQLVIAERVSPFFQ